MFDLIIEAVVMSFALGGIIGALVALHLAKNQHVVPEDETSTTFAPGLSVTLKNQKKRK